MPTCLLDKNVVRRAIEGIGKTQIDYNLNDNERSSLSLLLAGEQTDLDLFISIEMANILARYGAHPDVQVFLRFITVMQPTRYFKRWSRRLRGYDFTREDAKVLALGTFGTNSDATILGVDRIATFDQPLCNHVITRQRHLMERLAAMTPQLDEPYRFAKLPRVLSPHVFFIA